MKTWQRSLRILLEPSGRHCRRTLSTSASRTRIVDLLGRRADSNGIPVNVAGLIRTIRKQKRVAFAALHDGSTIHAAQLVLSPEQAASLSTGCAVVVSGKWLPSKGGAGQEFELHADTIKLQGDHDALGYPIQKKFHTPEFLRTIPHLRGRSAQGALLLRVRSQVIASMTEFFNQRGFVQTHTPIITSSDCEGAGEVFTVRTKPARSAAKAQQGSSAADASPFFGSEKYLTVSGQLHLEALAQSVGNVWTLSPTFRAEKSDTARHLSEFYMLEAELAFIDDLQSVMIVVQDLIRHVANQLKMSRTGEELLFLEEAQTVGHSEHSSPAPGSMNLEARWSGLLRDEWPRMTFYKACTVLRTLQTEGKTNFEVMPDETTGLQTEHERYLADVLHNGPVFVTDYPKAIKPFYMSPSALGQVDSGPVPTVACFDLLLPEVCEVVGGSMREHRLEELSRRMRDETILSSNTTSASGAPIPLQDNESSDMEWYLDLRRYGSLPHGGFGLGFDRLLGFLAGVSNVRDVVAFPRHYNRALC